VNGRGQVCDDIEGAVECREPANALCDGVKFCILLIFAINGDFPPGVKLGVILGEARHCSSKSVGSIKEDSVSVGGRARHLEVVGGLRQCSKYCGMKDPCSHSRLNVYGICVLYGCEFMETIKERSSKFIVHRCPL
jgi:hypothetical protein